MSDLQTLDQAFVSIVGDWTKLAASCAEGAVTNILQNSREYLSSDHQKALQDFHGLYFVDGDMASSKEAMNREVDDLFDAIQGEMSAGGDLSQFASVKEDEDAKRTRLSLSGVQKHLESIIQMESGVKDRLFPILTSMQFEDAIKQRLTRLAQIWQLAVDCTPENATDIEAVNHQILGLLGSKSERNSFYPIVLNMEPPKDQIEDLSWFDSIS